MKNSSPSSVISTKPVDTQHNVERPIGDPKHRWHVSGSLMCSDLLHLATMTNLLTITIDGTNSCSSIIWMSIIFEGSLTLVWFRLYFGTKSILSNSFAKNNLTSMVLFSLVNDSCLRWLTVSCYHRCHATCNSVARQTAYFILHFEYIHINKLH